MICASCRRRHSIDLLYVSAQLTWWYTLTGAMMVESGRLVAQSLTLDLAADGEQHLQSLRHNSRHRKQPHSYCCGPRCRAFSPQILGELLESTPGVQKTSRSSTLSPYRTCGRVKAGVNC